MCLHKYFQEDCRYDSDCFRRLIYTHWTTSHSNIMTPRPIQQKCPTFQINSCLFDEFFTYRGLNINIQSTPVLLTKILENVFHALKLPQSQYHLIWTPKFKSKENEFQRSFRGGPFQICTLIFSFSIFFSPVRHTTYKETWDMSILRPQNRNFSTLRMFCFSRRKVPWIYSFNPHNLKASASVIIFQFLTILKIFNFFLFFPYFLKLCLKKLRFCPSLVIYQT